MGYYDHGDRNDVLSGGIRMIPSELGASGALVDWDRFDDSRACHHRHLGRAFVRGNLLMNSKTRTQADAPDRRRERVLPIGTSYMTTPPKVGRPESP